MYTDAEFQMIIQDVRMYKELGADDIVVGCLKADGSLDMDKKRELRERADGIVMTLHRAFDVCGDPYETPEEAIALGIDMIFTHGQKDNCMDGKDMPARQVLDAHYGAFFR